MIDIAAPVYFYDKNGTSEIFYKLKTILYIDDEICLCVAKPTHKHEHLIQPHQTDLKFIFYMDDGFVDSQFEYSLRATNELNIAESYLID